MPEDVEEQRAVLLLLEEDLEAQLAGVRADLKAVRAALAEFKRPRGRPRGAIIRTPSIVANRLATIRAYTMRQKYFHIQKKGGSTKKTIPDEVIQEIVAKACEALPLASPERVRELINRTSADPENRPVSGGYLFRVRANEFLDRSDDYLDI